MSIKVFNNVEVNEGSDAEYECTFVGADDAETVLVPSAVVTIAATLKNMTNGAVINSRLNQNVLNVNDGTLASDGVFTLKLGTLDNAIVGLTTGVEQHRLSLHITYTRVVGGAGVLNHEVRYFVKALRDI